MLDKDRILSKIDELEGYLRDIQKIVPASINDYQKIEIKRSSERLIQLSIECTIDICRQFVSGLRLGLPAEENDIFDKLGKEKILSQKMVSTLKEMRGFRNILVHEYGFIDDELVFEILTTRLSDFQAFKQGILVALGNI